CQQRNNYPYMYDF
nr:immunoglobulin light chain junction region [Macaca mulatta]